MSAQPAFADSGYLAAGRMIKYSGDRDSAKIAMKVTDAAKGGLHITFGLGPEANFEQMGISLYQHGGDKASREVQGWAYGDFKIVNGDNCEGVSFINCTRGNFHWDANSLYKAVLVRGDQNEKGRWLWRLKIIDVANDNKETVLLVVRGDAEKIGASGSSAKEEMAPMDCSSFKRFASKVTLQDPRGTDSEFGSTTNYHEGCEGADLAAPVNDARDEMEIVIKP